MAILVVLLLCLDGHVIHLGALAPQLGPSFRSSWTTLGQALGESGGSFWEPWGSLGRALGEPWGRLGLFCAGLNVAVYPHSGVHFTTSKKVDKKWKPRCACKGRSLVIVFTLFSWVLFLILGVLLLSLGGHFTYLGELWDDLGGALGELGGPLGEPLGTLLLILNAVVAQPVGCCCSSWGVLMHSLGSL